MLPGWTRAIVFETLAIYPLIIRRTRRFSFARRRKSTLTSARRGAPGTCALRGM
jgi:hypothetical protein